MASFGERNLGNNRTDTGYSSGIYGYDDNQDNKPTKAIIGVAILVVLSLVLYELNPKAANPDLAATPATQNIAAAPARTPGQ